MLTRAATSNDHKNEDPYRHRTRSARRASIQSKEKTDEEEVAVAKKGRGRPRKSDFAPPTDKKRGRPRKSDVAAVENKKSPKDHSVSKDRGENVMQKTKKIASIRNICWMLG